MTEPTAPMSDEAIAQLVALVEAAELMASSMDCKVSAALQMMLKSFQVMARITGGKAITAFSEVPASKKVQ